MAGRKMLERVNAKINELGGEELGEDWLFHQLADGVKLAKIAEQVGCSRPYLYVWRDQAPHAERRQKKWADAMLLSGTSQAEDAGTVLDDLVGRGAMLTSPEVSLALARSNYKMRLAEARDRNTFGKQPAAGSLVVNIDTLYLEALEQAGRPRAITSGDERVVDADYEMVGEGDDVEHVQSD